jgi:hypothetical protein
MLLLDSSFISPAPHPGSWRLGRSLALGHAKEYVCVTRAITPLALAFVSLEIVSTLQALHLLISRSPCFDFFMDF